MWSLSPVVYAATYAALTRHPRALVMAACVAAWGARLTRNFARKGGYGPEEDYRWPILRRWIARVDPSGEHGVLAQLFSLGFVAAYQNLLIWAFVAPSFHASTAAPGVAPLGAADALLAALFLALLAGEHYTDEAQWAFQAAKARLSPAARAAAGGDLARGFCTAGPFAYSRHANFFCEQAMWWTVFAFAAAATRGGARGAAYAAVGPALLSALFQGSTWMTELVSVGKYPAYSAYQATTSMLVPWTPGASLDSPEGRALVRAAEAAAAAKKAKAKAAAA